jgi:HAD superfamily hydrolase (TIGR01549 family)
MPSATIRVVFFDLGDTLVSTSRDWIPGAKETLSTLRTKGVRLGLISNTGTLSRTQLLQLLPADFDLTVFDSGLLLLSSEVGCEKPALTIFQLAVERTAELASHCLFCTENLLDTLAAQQIGLRVARLQKPPASDLHELIHGMTQVRMLL